MSAELNFAELEGDVVLFSQSSGIRDNGTVEQKLLFNSKTQNAEKILIACESFFKRDEKAVFEKGKIRDSKNYLLVRENDSPEARQFLIVAAEPYQIQVTVSHQPIKPELFSLTRSTNFFVEDLKEIKDPGFLVALKGNLHQFLPVIGGKIPHRPQAKYIRAISDYAVLITEKDTNLNLDISLDFMLAKFCEEVNQYLSDIKKLIPADKNITFDHEIKNDTRLQLSISVPVQQLKAGIEELKKIAEMDADELKKQLKIKEQQEKLEKAKKARANKKSADEKAAKAAAPKNIPSHLD